jgi:hypothetical protein
MPAYGDRIAHNDRWAVVHFLRELQQRAGTIQRPQPLRTRWPTPGHAGRPSVDEGLRLVYVVPRRTGPVPRSPNDKRQTIDD